ncbi:hypothetical protein [Halobacteriovorax sp.]|uniref:hypothetical protein n=1 Tax=Halobacteriovorax sp. TaxID=2020862 RepID=UPI003AF2FE04
MLKRIFATALLIIFIYSCNGSNSTNETQEGAAGNLSELVNCEKSPEQLNSTTYRIKCSFLGHISKNIDKILVDDKECTNLTVDGPSLFCIFPNDLLNENKVHQISLTDKNNNKQILDNEFSIRTKCALDNPWSQQEQDAVLPTKYTDYKMIELPMICANLPLSYKLESGSGEIIKANNRFYYLGTSQDEGNELEFTRIDNKGEVINLKLSYEAKKEDDANNSTVDNQDKNEENGLTHCSWSTDQKSGYTRSDSNLGEFNICQSTENKNDIYLQVKEPDILKRVCIIPTYEKDGRETFLGAAICRHLNDSNVLNHFSLRKDRDYGRYMNFPLERVLIVKEELIELESPYNKELLTYDGFFICAINLDLYNDSSYCDTFFNKKKHINIEF